MTKYYGREHYDNHIIIGKFYAINNDINIDINIDINSDIIDIYIY